MMGVVILLIFVGIIGYLIVCTLAGVGPASARLSGFRPEIQLGSRAFTNPAPEVLEAYRKAVRSAPGMSIIDENPSTLLIDCKPTPRILDGSFGMVVRVHFETQATGSTVHTEGSQKVAFAIVLNPSAAGRHMERSLRMRAKKHGLSEVI